MRAEGVAGTAVRAAVPEGALTPSPAARYEPGLR